MKTVWAIVSGEYSSYRVLAVAEDETTAEAWAAAFRSEADEFHSDARVETFDFLSAGTQPKTFHFVYLNATLWDDGRADEPHIEEGDRLAVGDLYGLHPVRPARRFVRAPMHNGKGGRLEIRGQSRAAVMKVYSEQLSIWKSNPKTYHAE